MTKEVDEMSAASRGSRMINPNKVILDGEQSDAIIVAQAAEIRRLTLTDAERESLRRMLPTIMYEPHRVAVESILQRLG